MADRPTITVLGAGARYDTSTLNTNFQALRDWFDYVLGLDGTGGDNNTMTGDLDMAGHTLRNALFDGDVAGVDWKGPWVTATAYVVNDLVSESGNAYICTVAHTSGTFSTDLAAVKWQLFAAKGAAGAGTGDMLTTANLSDLANKSTSRTNLAVLGIAANLSDIASPSTARDNLVAMGTDSNEIYAASAAGTDTYAMTTAPVFAAYTEGMLLTMKADVANTGAATLNVSALGAKDIKKFDSTGKVALVTGDILANQMCRFVYDGTDMILLNPSPTSSASTGSMWVPINTQTVSGSSAVNFNGLLTSTYDTYKIVGEHILPSTAMSIGVRLGTGAGPTYATASYVNTQRCMVTTDTIDQRTSGGSVGTFDLDGAGGFTSSLPAEFEIVINCANTTGKAKLGRWTGCCQTNTSVLRVFEGAGVATDATVVANVITSLRVLPSTGTVTGVFTLYGLARS